MQEPPPNPPDPTSPPPPIDPALARMPPWIPTRPVPAVPPDELNEQQRQAVEHLHGALLVLAPVGTGKTTVIAHRAAHAVRAGIDPHHILCLSFTNRAAREMRERIVSLLGGRAGEVCVRTFHGFCTHVLRHEADALGIPADFTICDEEDAREVLVDLGRRQGLKSEVAARVGEVFFKLVERMKLSLVGVGTGPSGATGAATPPTHGPCEDSRAVFRGGPGGGPREALQALTEEAEPALGPDLAMIDPARLLADYNAALAAAGALDFSDLILKTDRLFVAHPDRLARWQRQFPWIQVDEVQDTNFPEYHLLARLAALSHDLAFFGDIDQTIYEWRGSDPFRSLGEFKRDFHPVREVALTINYRSDRNILQACESVIKACPRTVTRSLRGPAAAACRVESSTSGQAGAAHAAAGGEGRSIVTHAEQTLEDETRWIASTIKELIDGHGVSRRQIAILVRSNATAAAMSAVLASEGIDHFKVDRVRFFRQPEVKDALAHVRCLLNRHDSHSLIRALRRPVKIDPAIIEEVRSLPADTGLRLTDFVDPLTFAYLDPFGLLLHRLAEGRVVVFDVESTGLDVTRDDVVELAALKVGTGGPGQSFHALLRTDRPLEESARIHGITPEVLAQSGRDPGEVVREFLTFLGGCVVVGHNVAYDVGIVSSQLKRLGLAWPESSSSFDTLDLTRRFFNLQSYTLANVCRQLQLTSTPSHRAMDDVWATWHLLQRLLPCLLLSRPQRECLVARLAPAFVQVNDLLQGWRALIDRERPPRALEAILEESGLRGYWAAQEDAPKRLANLAELVRLLSVYDDPELAPREAMLNAVYLAALGNEVDRHVGGEEKVFLLTAHQAKGLEFDTVFIAGATDRHFPSARSVKEGRTDEEHRLFYVAMTRARRRLFISHHHHDDRGRAQEPSRFLASIPESLRSPL
jgi:ATP-dependent DNA helicase UvrD/PcrA